jgi:hypothetical protein
MGALTFSGLAAADQGGCPQGTVHCDSKPGTGKLCCPPGACCYTICCPPNTRCVVNAGQAYCVCPL